MLHIYQGILLMLKLILLWHIISWLPIMKLLLPSDRQILILIFWFWSVKLFMLGSFNNSYRPLKIYLTDYLCNWNEVSLSVKNDSKGQRSEIFFSYQGTQYLAFLKQNTEMKMIPLSPCFWSFKRWEFTTLTATRGQTITDNHTETPRMEYLPTLKSPNQPSSKHRFSMGVGGVGNHMRKSSLRLSIKKDILKFIAKYSILLKGKSKLQYNASLYKH